MFDRFFWPGKTVAVWHGDFVFLSRCFSKWWSIALVFFIRKEISSRPFINSFFLLLFVKIYGAPEVRNVPHTSPPLHRLDCFQKAHIESFVIPTSLHITGSFREAQTKFCAAFLNIPLFFGKHTRKDSMTSSLYISESYRKAQRRRHTHVPFSPKQNKTYSPVLSLSAIFDNLHFRGNK